MHLHKRLKICNILILSLLCKMSAKKFRGNRNALKVTKMNWPLIIPLIACPHHYGEWCSLTWSQSVAFLILQKALWWIEFKSVRACFITITNWIMISSYQVIFCLKLYVSFVVLTFLINIVSKVCNLRWLVLSFLFFNHVIVSPVLVRKCVHHYDREKKV